MPTKKLINMENTVTTQENVSTESTTNNIAAENKAIVNNQTNTSAENDMSHLAALSSVLGDKSETAQKINKDVREHLSNVKKQESVVEKPVEKPVENVVTTPTDSVIETDEIEVEGGLKITLPGSKQKSAQKAEYKTPEEAFEAMKTSFGVQASTPSEFVEKATKAFNGHRAQAQKAGELENKINDINKSFENMPAPLLEAFSAWANGEDYKEAIINSNGIDYSKSSEKQDMKSLVNSFFPGKFTEEDFEEHEYTNNSALEIATQASLDKFNTIKGQRELAAKNAIETQKRYIESFDASVASAVSRITEELPYYTDKAAIPAIKADTAQLHTLRGTVLEKYFLNADGTVLPGAAARMAMLRDGQSIISAIVDRENQKAASKATEQIVSRGADTPSSSAGHNVNNGNKLPEEVQRVLNMLPKKKSVY